MQRKTILGLAIRIIAVLLLVWSLRDLVQMSSYLLAYWGQEGNPQMGNVLMFLSPVITLIIALVFMKSANSIAEKAYPIETMEDIDEAGIFNLAMKVIGLAFMVWAIPKGVQIIAKFFYLSYLAPSLSHGNETMYIVDHLPMVVLFLLLGWYLLKDGRLFTRMAFGENQE